MTTLLNTLDSSTIVTSEEELDALYGEPNPLAMAKELDVIIPHYRAFIERSPFVVLATSGPEGLDCSPRGDPPGFVRVHDAKTVLLPDRRGNNRVDALRNIVRDPRVSLLFLIPGVNETMRINGTAQIVNDDALTASFAVNGKNPRTVIVVTVDRIYFQCPKALVRSHLWSADAQIPRSDLPTIGQMMEVISKGSFDGAAWDESYSERMKETIY